MIVVTVVTYKKRNNKVTTSCISVGSTESLEGSMWDYKARYTEEKLVMLWFQKHLDLFGDHKLMCCEVRVLPLQCVHLPNRLPKWVCCHVRTLSPP